MAGQEEKRSVPLEYSPRREGVPVYRKILSGVLVLAGVVLVMMGVVLLLTDGAAWVNLLTVGVGLVVWGSVIWFQT